MRWTWIIVLALPLFLLLLLQYRTWLDDTGLLASFRLQAEIVRLRSNIADQQSANDRLDIEVNDLHQSDQIIEEKAREDLGMIGPEESFYLIIESQ